MSRPFSNYSAKPTFAQVNESNNASSYTQFKKTKYSFCKPNICHPNKNIGSQGDLLLLRAANSLLFNPCNFDKNELYINLYTKLDLSDLSDNTPIISDLASSNFPVTISTTVTPYLTYNIDPSGVLFGNTTCGINNYLNFLTYDTSLNTIN